MERQEVKFAFKPNEEQAKFFASNKKFLLANGGVGSGKSSIIVNMAQSLSLTYPGTVGIIGRKTYPELRDTTRKEFFKWIHLNGIQSLIKKWNQTENRLVWYNDSEVLFRALDDIYKLGSINLGWWLLDEWSEFENPDDFTYLRTRLRDPKGPLIGGGATNPATKEHWLHKVFIEQQSPDYEVFEIPTYSNKEHLPPEYIADLEKLPEEWQERYLNGRWGIVPKGTRVITKFHPSVHLGRFAYNKYMPIMRGWDFGFRHPACIFSQETDLGRWLFLKEMLGTEIYIDDFAEKVIKKSNEWFPGMQFEDYCDIAGTQRSDKSKITSIQALRNKGIDPTYRKIVDKENVLMNFNNLFERNVGTFSRIGIDREGCPIFSDALAGGYYRDKEGGPTGDDYFDHLVDGALYIFINVFAAESNRRLIPTFRDKDSYVTLSQMRV